MKDFKILLLIASFSVMIVSFCSCDKEDPEPDTSEEIPLVYTSLTADKTTLYIGETATLTSTASGKEIVYIWEASAGTLVGSGSTVTYTTTPCLLGENTITCRVEDDYGNSESKSIIIVVQ